MRNVLQDKYANNSDFEYIIGIKRCLLLLCVLCAEMHTLGQGPSFDHKSAFIEGIYTAPEQLRSNTPRYSLQSTWIEGNSDIFTYDGFGQKVLITDSIFAAVRDQKVQIFYQNSFFDLINIGPLSTFYLEHFYYDSYSNEIPKTRMHYVDMRSGEVFELLYENLEKSIASDSLLHQKFIEIPENKRKKSLYKYLIQFNQSNPF